MSLAGIVGTVMLASVACLRHFTSRSRWPSHLRSGRALKQAHEVVVAHDALGEGSCSDCGGGSSVRPRRLQMGREHIDLRSLIE